MYGTAGARTDTAGWGGGGGVQPAINLIQRAREISFFFFPRRMYGTEGGGFARHRLPRLFNKQPREAATTNNSRTLLNYYLLYFNTTTTSEPA